MSRPALQIAEDVLELESKVGVKQGFFAALLDEDDWSFVIKLHALFEAACTHLLLFHFKEPDLAEVVSRLELSNKTTGKLAFLSRLELLGKEGRRLISTLSELRNNLVHDVRNAEFSLAEMVAKLDANELKQFAISFSPYETRIRRFPFDPSMNLGYPPDIQEHATVDKMIERLKVDPKFHIWVGSYSVLTSILDMYGYSDYRQWVQAKKHFEDDEAL
jgi:hypothetical protein